MGVDTIYININIGWNDYEVNSNVCMYTCICTNNFAEKINEVIHILIFPYIFSLFKIG